MQTGTNFFGVLAGGTSDADEPAAAPSAEAANDADLPAQQREGPERSRRGQGRPAGLRAGAADAQGRDEQHRQRGPAGAPSPTSPDAVDSIAAEMARFYASDVLYKDYAVPQIVGALRAAGITVGGLGGQQLNADQFLPSIDWLDPTHVATTLHVTLPSSTTTTQHIAPGLHGHELNSVSVGGTHAPDGLDELDPGQPGADIHAGLHERRPEHRDQRQMPVTVSGSSVSGQTVVPQTTAGESTSCQVTLSSTPPKGSHTLTATIVPVPGENEDREQHVDVPGHVPVEALELDAVCLSCAVHDLTSTAGIVAIAAGAGAVIGTPLLRDPRRQAAPAPRRSARDSRRAATRTSSRMPPRCSSSSRRCTTTSRRRPSGSRAGWTRPSTGSTARSRTER